MKKLLIFIAALTCSAGFAQQNSLLQQDFWKGSPSVETVRKEIEKGNNPAELNAMSFDPVVMAINGTAPVETIKYLLDQPGNNVGKLTHDARTYLHWAAVAGNVEVVEYLISKGARANITDSHGTTPINFAASAGQLSSKIYDLCIAHGADLKKDLNGDGANALLLAVAADKDFTLTNYFIAKGLDLKSKDADGNNAFSYAARGGNIEVLKTLLQKGVPKQDNAMLMAAQGSRRAANPIEVYQYLESIGVNPAAVGKDGENVLHALVRGPKQTEIIRYFISKGVDVNKADQEGDTALMNAAAANRDTTVLGLLVTKSVNINQANKKGITALAMAVRSNNAEIVGYLISKGASVSVVDANGNNLGTYLIQAFNPQRTNEFDAKLKILLEKGLEISRPQKNGNTLYHLAVTKNDISLLKRLENYKIDINAKNSEGLTALHKAAMISKDDSILKYLIALGAKADVQTNFQETAFDLAKENESLSKNNININFLK